MNNTNEPLKLKLSIKKPVLTAHLKAKVVVIDESIGTLKKNQLKTLI